MSFETYKGCGYLFRIKVARFVHEIGQKSFVFKNRILRIYLLEGFLIKIDYNTREFLALIIIITFKIQVDCNQASLEMGRHYIFINKFEKLKEINFQTSK